MIDIKPGDEVVCISDKWRLIAGTMPEGLCGPVKDGIYTVKQVYTPSCEPNNVYLRLVEFPKAGYISTAFRKVIHLDNFDFRKQLNKVPQHA